MQIGMIGLGKMGFNLAFNLKNNGHDVHGFDLSKHAREKASQSGFTTYNNLDDLINVLKAPRIIWVMVPAGKSTDSVLTELFAKLKADDIVIEGGNSHYKDSIRRAEEAAKKEIHYLDVGTSGGTSGANQGACLMIGGKKEIFDRAEPIFKDVTVENGYLYAGETGSGHFLKMVHNGIEYGMMQAIGEGFQIVEQSDYNFDLAAVAKVWNNGSVIRSWLMELSESAFRKEAHLDSIKGVVDASGEAKWTLETALDMEVPIPVIALSLMMRNRSKEEDSFSAKVVAALRNEFGGHSVVKSE